MVNLAIWTKGTGTKFVFSIDICTATCHFTVGGLIYCQSIINKNYIPIIQISLIGKCSHWETSCFVCCEWMGGSLKRISGIDFPWRNRNCHTSFNGNCNGYYCYYQYMSHTLQGLETNDRGMTVEINRYNTKRKQEIHIWCSWYADTFSGYWELLSTWMTSVYVLLFKWY